MIDQWENFLGGHLRIRHKQNENVIFMYQHNTNRYDV